MSGDYWCSHCQRTRERLGGGVGPRYCTTCRGERIHPMPADSASRAAKITALRLAIEEARAELEHLEGVWA